MKNNLEKGIFGLDHLGQVFKGYYNKDYNWNGWACPYFTFQEAIKLAAVDNFELIKFDPESGCFLYKNQDYSEEQAEVIKPEKFHIDGEEITLFAFSLGWVWNAIDPKQREKDEHFCVLISNLYKAHKAVHVFIDNFDNNGNYSVSACDKYPYETSFDELTLPLYEFIKAVHDELNVSFKL
jgi:hypothetical protein